MNRFKYRFHIYYEDNEKGKGCKTNLQNAFADKVQNFSKFSYKYHFLHHLATGKLFLYVRIALQC